MLRSLVIVGCLVTMLVPASAQQTFDDIRRQMKSAFEGVNPDGSVRVSKQLRRWEWYWESRLKQDGTLPTPADYVKAIDQVRTKGVIDQAQSVNEWKELGPVGPTNLSVASSFYGIGRVNCVAFSQNDANLLYLGSAQGGLWRSTNGGSSWQWVQIAGMPIFGVSDIAIAPNNDKVIYVATGDAATAIAGDINGYPGFSYGVIKSTDGGATWATTGLSYQPEQNYGVGRLWIDPTNSNTLLAATTLGIRRTTDGGATWRLVSSNANVRDLVQHPTIATILYAGTFNQGGNAALWRSTDAGQTWSVQHTEPAACRWRIAVTKASPSTVWAVASATYPYALNGVFKSTNVGEDYEKVYSAKNLLGWSRSGNDFNRGGQGWYDLAMAASPTDPTRVFVGGVNNWRTTNGGATFELATEQNGDGAPWVHADQHFLAFHPINGRLFACHDGGIARSTDGGQTWSDCSVGLSIQQYYAFATTDRDPNLMIAGAQDNSTTIFEGTRFAHHIGGDGMECAIDPNNSSILYGSVYYGTFYRTTNRGNSWTVISTQDVRNEPGAWVAPLAVSRKTANTIFAGYSNVWRSSNNGSSWSRISSFGSSATLRTLAVAPSDDRYIYAAFSQAMYVTSDGGANWKQLSGLGGFITDIEVDPTNPKRIWVTYGAFNSGIKVAEITDGVVKNVSGNGLPNVPANTITVAEGSPRRLFLGTDAGVYVCDIGSTLWSPYGSAMPTTVISDLEVLPSTKKLRAATYGRGIWEVDITQCTATKPSVKALTSTTVCSGDSVILEVEGSYARVRWSNGDTTRRVVLRSVTETGDYSAGIEDANGCRATSDAISIVIQRTPSKPSVQRRGDTLRSTTLGGVTSFQWKLNDVDIAGATNREHLPLVAGAYSVLVKNDAGCSNLSDPVNVTLTSVAETERMPVVSIAPNPTTDAVMLMFGVTTVSEAAITITNIDGQNVLATLIPPGVATTRIDLSHVPAGVYMLRCSMGGTVVSIPIVRQ
ncbi:MAG: T9SS type A sorting domain-containing protein [Candidatus Kapabacteria bacterium]|nr:T9SS type A sorting domain-containing protein [Candidatus Kapabacteria bacterium]